MESYARRCPLPYSHFYKNTYPHTLPYHFVFLPRCSVDLGQGDSRYHQDGGREGEQKGELEEGEGERGEKEERGEALDVGTPNMFGSYGPDFMHDELSLRMLMGTGGNKQRSRYSTDSSQIRIHNDSARNATVTPTGRYTRYGSGQLRYAAGTKDMPERYFKGEDFPPQKCIVKEEKLARQYL